MQRIVERSGILQKAEKLVSTDRDKEHGDAHKNFKMGADFWSVYLGHKIYPHEVPMMMAMYKIARSTENPYNIDNYTIHSIDNCTIYSIDNCTTYSIDNCIIYSIHN